MNYDNVKTFMLRGQKPFRYGEVLGCWMCVLFSAIPYYAVWFFYNPFKTPFPLLVPFVVAHVIHGITIMDKFSNGISISLKVRNLYTGNTGVLSALTFAILSVQYLIRADDLLLLLFGILAIVGVTFSLGKLVFRIINHQICKLGDTEILKNKKKLSFGFTTILLFTSGPIGVLLARIILISISHETMQTPIFIAVLFMILYIIFAFIGVAYYYRFYLLGKFSLSSEMGSS